MKPIYRLSFFVLALCASPATIAQDCVGPLVGFGEIRSGLEAGFQAGSLSLTIPDPATGEPTPLADGLFLAAAGVDQRGFIDPESGSGWLCEGDWGLVQAWFLSTNRLRESWGLTRAEYLEYVNGFVQTRILVDGVEHEPLETRARWGTVSAFDRVTDGAGKTWGVFIEPNSLAPGLHTSELIWRVDLQCLPLSHPSGWGAGQCDGVYETDTGSAVYEFEIIPIP